MRYSVTCITDATIKEKWLVTSERPLTNEEISGLVTGDDEIPATLEFVEQVDVWGETDREVAEVKEI